MVDYIKYTYFAHKCLFTSVMRTSEFVKSIKQFWEPHHESVITVNKTRKNEFNTTIGVLCFKYKNKNMSYLIKHTHVPNMETQIDYDRYRCIL